ncbi:MAG: YdeI/OmpD-associated family protein [Candidatus Omnitrophota bacterium]|nr:MAG: YdeI/OmpD-associated family protein [Candidatus Omnitrophota bacterium]
MKSEKPLYFKNRNEWRKWLKQNHKKSDGVWLMYYKKHTGKPSITHTEGVEEALCFGWIDSRINRIDEQRYIQKYTPRRKNSFWSKINKQAAEKLTRQKKMTKAGLIKIQEAKRSGKWDKAYTSKKKWPMPPDLKKALVKNKKAWKNFQNFANSYQNMYAGWVSSAKTEKTKKQRIKKIIKLAAINQKMLIM